MKENTKKVILGIAIFLLLLVPISIAIVRINNDEEGLNNPDKEQIVNNQNDEDQIDKGDSESIELIATSDNTNAFELLQEKHEVVFDQFDFGVFIKSIDGLEGNNENYWAVYVNGVYAEIAIDKTVLNSGDKLELIYEKVSTELF